MRPAFGYVVAVYVPPECVTQAQRQATTWGLKVDQSRQI